MKLLFVFLFSFLGALAQSQDSWKACLDKKVILSAKEENEQKNLINLSSTDLKKAKTFLLNFKEGTSQKGWERTIIVFDDKDAELKKQSGKKFSIKTSELKTLFQKSKTLKIYTIYLPTDPKMRAQIRVRRVHLCTLVLQS